MIYILGDGLQILKEMTYLLRDALSLVNCYQGDVHLYQWRSQDFTVGYSTYKIFSMHMCNNNRRQNQYKIDPNAQLK